jgi:hypothetical protein
MSACVELTSQPKPGVLVNKQRRAGMIINHVQMRDERWGRAGPPQTHTTDKPSRVISDDPMWLAHLTREHQHGPDGQLWDLIQLFVYGELKMTAIFHGEDVELRLFRPGPWERTFTIIQSSDQTPLLP